MNDAGERAGAVAEPAHPLDQTNVAHHLDPVFTRVMDARDEGPAIAEVARRLRARFPGAGPAVIEAMVSDLHRTFDGTPIRDFVPVLVEREAMDRLSSMAG